MRSMPEALGAATRQRLTPTERASLLEAAASDRRSRRRQWAHGWLGRLGFRRGDRSGPAFRQEAFSGSERSDPLQTLVRFGRSELDYEALSRRLLSSWLYPALLFTAAVTVCALTAPASGLAEMLESFDMTIPAVYAFLLWWNTDMWPIVAGLTYAFVALLLSTRLISPLGGDRLVWLVPLIGSAHRLIELSAMSRSVAILVEDGRPLESALLAARDSIRSASLRRWLRRAADDEASGRGLQGALQRIPGGDEILSVAAGDPGVTGIPADRGWWLAARYYHLRAHRHVDLVAFSCAVLGYLLTALVITSLLSGALVPIVLFEIQSFL